MKIMNYEFKTVTQRTTEETQRTTEEGRMRYEM